MPKIVSKLVNNNGKLRLVICAEKRIAAFGGKWRSLKTSELEQMTPQLRRGGRYTVDDSRRDLTVIHYNEPVLGYDEMTTLFLELALINPDPIFDAYVESDFGNPTGLNTVDNTLEISEVTSIPEQSEVSHEVEEVKDTVSAMESHESGDSYYDSDSDSGGCDCDNSGD